MSITEDLFHMLVKKLSSSSKCECKGYYLYFIIRYLTLPFENYREKIPKQLCLIGEYSIIKRGNYTMDLYKIKDLCTHKHEKIYTNDKQLK